MQHGCRLVADHHVGDEILVADVAHLQRPPFHRFPMTGRKIVECDGRQAGSMERLAHMAADIAGAAGDQNGRLL
jgi:hypothetical protein